MTKDLDKSIKRFSDEVKKTKKLLRTIGNEEYILIKKTDLIRGAKGRDIKIIEHSGPITLTPPTDENLPSTPIEIEVDKNTILEKEEYTGFFPKMKAILSGAKRKQRRRS